MESRDELCEKLLQATRELLEATQVEDIERIGRALDTRQGHIEQYAALKKQKMTETQKAKFNELIILDKKANISMRKLMEKYKDDIKLSRVKYDGLMKYNSSSLNLSSGRVIDKKR